MKQLFWIINNLFVKNFWFFDTEGRISRRHFINDIRFDPCNLYVFRARKRRFSRKCGYFCQRFYFCNHFNLYFSDVEILFQFNVDLHIKHFVLLFTVTDIFMLNRLELRIEWINSYFLNANVEPWRRVHFLQKLCNYFNVLLFFVLVPYANMLISSISLNAFVKISWHLQMFSKSTLYYKYNIENIGKFSDMFALTANKIVVL